MLSQNSMYLLEKRYLDKKDNETPSDLFKRVASSISLGDKKLEKEFYASMASLDFLPSSPILLNAGKRIHQLCSSFVLPVHDNFDSVLKTMQAMAKIHKTGAGIGFNFSNMRSGSFSPLFCIKLFDEFTSETNRQNVRPGSNMAILNADHPDIHKFITAKENEGSLLNFNMSVGIHDSFMNDVRKGGKRSLRLFRLICKNAWKNGEPGVLFLDRINKANPTPGIGQINATDSCGEQPLLDYEACPLGSINLANMVKGKKIDWECLGKTVKMAVSFLDNAIDASDYLSEKTENIVKSNRKIGLGIMGFHDMLIDLEIPYSTEKAVKTADSVMAFIKKHARIASSMLASAKGVFPNWKKSIYYPALKLRNAALTTIAPTGSISILADASAGIEPLFALSYTRIYKGKKLTVTNKKYDKLSREGIGNKGLQKLFAVSHEIRPEYHIKIQAAFQKHVDSAVSKTVIMPNSAKVSDVEKAFLLAYELGCKGITIYRQGSRNKEVIKINKNIIADVNN